MGILTDSSSAVARGHVTPRRAMFPDVRSLQSEQQQEEEEREGKRRKENTQEGNKTKQHEHNFRKLKLGKKLDPGLQN